MPPFRPANLPAELAAHLPRRYRVLASAPLRSAEWAVATTTHLGVLGADGVRWLRPWHEVDRGSWDEQTRTVVVRWVQGEQDTLVLAGDAGRNLAEAFRERVQSSVVHTEHLELRGGVTVRAVIRRDENGELLSQVIAEGEVGARESDERAVRALEARARRAVGLPG